MERVLKGIIAISILLGIFYVWNIEYNIREFSTQYKIPPNLVRSIIRVESGFYTRAKSSAGAIGLMQIMPATFNEWAKKCKIKEPDIYNVEDNIQVGCAYIAWLIKYWDGDVRLAIISYNRGFARVRREQGKVDWYFHKVMVAKKG